MMNENDLFDISAECLLNYLYPDLEEEWKVDCAGTFYRNYSPDILSVDPEKHTVRLARDSFLRLLPQGVIAREDALKAGNFEQQYEQLQKRKELLKDLFNPIDTLAFRTRLHLEKQAARLASDKLPLLLERYWGYDLTREENPYIRKVAPLLLLVSHLRGDFDFIRHLLSQVFDCPVRMKVGRYAWEEGSACSQPAVEYELLVEDLTAESYRELNRRIDPFREFLCEWFIPFDTRCTLALKDHHQPLVLGENLVLDYNTEIAVQSSTQHIEQ